MKSEILIDELKGITKENIHAVESFRGLTDHTLTFKLSEKSWSILECVEHLNYYGRFYIPEIKSHTEKSNFGSSSTFKSGCLGNYFAQSMLPKKKLNKMKTFKSMNPMNSALDRKVLDEFINQQTQMLELLSQAQHVHLTKVKTSITISKWIKLRLGDTFRIVVYHNLRHIVQAKSIMEAIQPKN